MTTVKLFRDIELHGSSQIPPTLTDAKFTSGMLDEAYNQGIVDSIKTVKICFNNNIKYVGPVSDLRDRLIQKLEALKKKTI